MAGKINLFNLGSLGVDLSKSPLHAEDGSLTQAQNAVPDNRGEAGGLAKRDGLVAINSTTAGGSVLGVVHVGLPLISTRSYYAASDDASNVAWVKSTDAFATGGALSNPATPQQAPYSGKLSTVITSFNVLKKMAAVKIGNWAYYAGGTYTAYPDASSTPPTIRKFDGTTDQEWLKIPSNPVVGATTNSYGIIDMCTIGSKIYVAVLDLHSGAPNYRGRVLECDTATDSIIQMGERFGPDSGEITGGMPMSLCVTNGFLWVGTYGGSGTSAAKILRLRPGIETSWTTDRSPSLGAVTGLIGFQGQLYALHSRTDSATAATVQVRTPSAAWSTSLTSGYAALGNGFTAPVVYQDALYVAQFDGAASSVVLIQKYNGTSWTTDYTPSSIASPGVGTLVNNSMLFYTISGADNYVFKKSGGSWSALNLSSVDGSNGLRGPLFVIET